MLIQDDRGVALLLALMATLLLSALAGPLVVLTTSETAIASNYRSALETFYAADAGLEYVMQELESMPQWNDILAGTVRSSLADAARRPRLLDGSLLDLHQETTHLQSVTDAVDWGGSNSLMWRLYAYGPVTGFLPTTEPVWRSMFVAVWVADDLSETDRNPLVDSNETLTLHARAYGPSNSRKIVEVVVTRPTGAADADLEKPEAGEATPGPQVPPKRGRLRILSWREIR